MRGERSSVEVVLERGGLEESAHRVHWASCDEDGALRAGGGDPGRVVFVRSAAKPFQALPLVEDGAAARWGIPPAELALCCGSHGAESEHVAGVRNLLARAGHSESALACGPHPPMNEDAARALERAGQIPGPIHNNCSGKHAGMLALARHHGWSADGYHRAEHPAQRRMLAEIARWSECPAEAIGRGVDGCGVICFALPLRAMAAAFARLAGAAERGEEGPRAVLEAMAAHPRAVAGTGRLCTELIEATGGRIIAKVGAEGIYGAADRAGRVGVALKVEDGARRAAEAALVWLLERLGVLEPEEAARLERWRSPVVANTLGEPAARLRPRAPRRGSEDGAVTPLTGLRGALVRVSAALAARETEGLERELASVLELGADRRAVRTAVEEALVQSHLFVGFPGALDALFRWRSLVTGADEDPAGGEAVAGVGGGDPGTSAATVRAGSGAAARPDPDEAELLERGAKVCRRVYGDQYERVRDGVARLHPDLDRWMVRDGYGKVLARPGLELGDRELCIVAVLAVQGASVQLYSHLRGALAVGVPPAVVEAALHEVEPWAEAAARAAMWDTWRRLRERRSATDDRGEVR